MSNKTNSTCQAIPVGTLIEEALQCLRKLGLQESTVTPIGNVWRHMASYMHERGYELYTCEVGKQYLDFRLQSSGLLFSERWAYRLVLYVNRLNEYLLTGSIMKREKLSPSFDSELGNSILLFLADKSAQKRFSKFTVDRNRYYLSVFLDYANRRNVYFLSELTVDFINAFLDALPQDKRSMRHQVISDLRLYLRYIYEQRMVVVNLSRLLPHDAYSQTEKLPSVYSKEEIIKLCNSMERSDASGKRDYAIIMLLSRYGLRVSDICGLCFDNIHWDECLIVLTQYKTHEKVELPLTKEVGEAIIDYLQYGRPKCDDSHVFLCGSSPFKPITGIMVWKLTTRAFHNAHIDISYRKHGAHALRHSLAALLLKEKVVLPVITGILGHKNSETTKNYLRVDIASLRQCTLDVPPVTTLFYSQKGGTFYE